MKQISAKYADLQCRPDETMLRLKRGQRRMLVDKLPDAANVAAAALVFGQALSDRPFSIGLAIVGLAVWLGMMLLAIGFARSNAEED